MSSVPGITSVFGSSAKVQSVKVCARTIRGTHLDCQDDYLLFIKMKLLLALSRMSPAFVAIGFNGCRWDGTAGTLRSAENAENC